MLNQLTLAVRTPPDSPWHRVELRLLVDGRDILADVFDAGPNVDPDDLLGGRSPLAPAEHSAEVRLAEADCTEGCCGAVYVRVARDGDEIRWDGWRNPDAVGVELEAYRFDARQYEAELARIDGDRGWEWPGRTIARLVRKAIADDPEILGACNSSLDFVQSQPDGRSEVELVFTSPPRSTVAEFYEIFQRPMEHRQFRLRLPVTGEPVPQQAQEIVYALIAEDPREKAEICGGYGHPIM